MKRSSIKWKIFQYLIAFCLLLLTILWLFQTVFLDSFYKQIKLSEIKKEAAALTAYIDSGDFDSVYNAVDRRGDLYVELWSVEDGSQILISNNREGPSSMFGENSNHAPKQGEGQSQYSAEAKQGLLQEAAENGGTLTKHFFGKAGFDQKKESILYVTLPAGQGDSLLLVSAYISPVNATVETLRIQLFYISAIMLALAVGLALLMSRRVAEPIEKLNDSAKELAKGDYDIAFHTEGYREIAELSDTLDQAARELAKTDSLRRELIANVSHDLRTPLTLITGYGEMIRDLPDENTKENMQVIIDEAKRLTALVSNLLDLSRLQSGTSALHLDRLHFTEEVQKIIGRFSKFCEQEQYNISFQYDESVCVHADPERISQVIYNFITNAITHTGDDKQVTVRQVVEGNRVMLEVCDTGEGIAPEDISLIWERYYKVDKVHKRAAMGSGLGLSIVKSILEQHPGVAYGVRSLPGQGSVFWFSLDVME